MDDTVYVLYYDKYFFFSIPYTELYLEDDSVTNSAVKYDHFIFHANQNTGYFLYNDSIKPVLKLNVDSICQAHALYAGASPFELLQSGLLQLNDRYDGDTTVKVFIPAKEYDADVFDSAFYYFSEKLNDIQFSFSKKLDSLMNKKLFKTKFFYKSKFSAILGKEAPERKISVSFKRIQSPNQKELVLTLKKWEKRIEETFPNDTLKFTIPRNYKFIDLDHASDRF